MKFFGVYYWYVKMPRYRYVEHGLKYFSFYVQKHIAHLATCSGPSTQPVHGGPLGAPAFLKLVYWASEQPTWVMHLPSHHRHRISGDPGVLCNIRYSSETDLKLKTCEISFLHDICFSCPNILQFCTEHDSDTTVLCAKFQDNWLLNEISRDLSLRWVSDGYPNIAQHPWLLWINSPSAGMMFPMILEYDMPLSFERI